MKVLKLHSNNLLKSDKIYLYDFFFSKKKKNYEKMAESAIKFYSIYDKSQFEERVFELFNYSKGESKLHAYLFKLYGIEYKERYRFFNDRTYKDE